METESGRNDAVLKKAEMLAESGLGEEAVELLISAARDGADPRLLQELAILYSDLGKVEDSELAWRKVRDLQPEAAYPLEGLGLLYLENHRLSDAEAAFAAALRLEETARTYILLGVTQMRLGKAADAESSLTRALAMEPENEEATFNLSLVFRDSRPGESAALLERSIELNPAYAPAHREFGRHLLKNGEYPEAEYHLRRAAELDFTDGWAQLYLGNLLWREGDLKGAEDAMKQAVRIWPEYSVPYRSVADLYRDTARLGEAERWYRRALELDEDDAEANIGLAVVLNEKGDRNAAKGYLNRALKADPSNKRAQWELRRITEP
jgi:Flp pilus assembly protein TadD